MDTKPTENSEDDSLFLSHYQQNLFDTKLENGNPSDKANVLRNLLVQLQFVSVTGRNGRNDTGHLAREHRESYSSIVDSFDEKTGLNNFAEGALTLCQGHANESQQWSSSLTSERLNSLTCVQNILSVGQHDTDRLLPPRKKNDLLPSRKRNILSRETTSLGRNVPIKLTQKKMLDQTECFQKSNVKHTGHVSDSYGEQHPRGTTAGAGISNVSTEYRTDRKPLFYSEANKATAFNQYGSRRDGGASNARQEWGEGSRMKRPFQETEEESSNGNTNPVTNVFKTAKQQLSIDNQRKYGGQQSRGGPVNTTTYGTAKKSLGPRRGPSSKFVPPVMSRDDDDGMSNHAADTITRAVLKTGGASSRGGAGGGATVEGLDDERLKGIEPKMVELIMNEIMDNGPKIGWDDIAGLEFAKKTIKEIVVWPMLRPDIFTGLRGPPKGLLLFGPPGTGKTLIGKCIACTSSSTFFCISASSLTSKWVGEGEKMVRALFAVARCNQPAVVFIDEIDSLLTQRTDGENEASRRIKTEFLVQLDGASTSSDDRILIVGATNRPQEIDEAARRRFVKRLYIPLPESLARQQIVTNLLQQQTFNLSPEELEDICQKTNGFSGADMATLCREAALGPIRDMSFGDIEHISADQVRPISYCDFVDALCNVKPSVSPKDLKAYLEWNNTFGSGSR